MREIPKLQTLCLRLVGSHSCSAEVTFAINQETGEPSKASQLLRDYHQRPIVLSVDDENKNGNNENETDNPTAFDHIPMARMVCVGPGSIRRAQANDVDLNHPLVAHHYVPPAKTDEIGGKEEEASNNNAATSASTPLVMEYGNPALDCLQSYIDSLVELGRMDDGRLGIHFFEEWKANVLVGAGQPAPASSNKQEDGKEDIVEDLVEEDAVVKPPPRKRSRRRSSVSTTAANNDNNANTTSSSTALRVRVKSGPPPPLGSLSLNNCAIAEDTFENMRESGMGLHLGVLDLTGIYQLSDVIMEQFLPHCPNVERLSIKNCRRLTVTTLQNLAESCQNLQFLDVGGVYNITPDEVIETLVVGSGGGKRPCPDLIELHASGLGWNDNFVKTVVEGCNNESDDEGDHEKDEEHPQEMRQWKALSFGFSSNLTALTLRKSLSKVSSTLISLALHFCEDVVDNALMGALGRNLPHVRYLDVRGNPSLNSMTGWYDGRASVYRVGIGGTRNNDYVEETEDAGEDGGAPTAAALAKVQKLTVLARFTGITKASIEDTLRVHPLQASKLDCIIDSGGAGVGIYR